MYYCSQYGGNGACCSAACLRYKVLMSGLRDVSSDTCCDETHNGCSRQGLADLTLLASAVLALPINGLNEGNLV